MVVAKSETTTELKGAKIMGTTTSNYQRKKRERENQKNRRKKQGQIEGLFKPGTEFGGGGRQSTPSA